MDKQVQKLNQRHRQSIRRGQLEEFFKQRRLMLEQVDLADAIDVLTQNLQKLKSLVMNESRPQDFIGPLIQLKKVTECCNSIDVFCQIANFTPDQVKAKQLPQNFTWIDLLLLMLRDTNQQSTFYEVIAQIVRNCMFELKDKMSLQTNENYYQLQMQRVMEHYPYEFLKEDSVKLVRCTLEVISYLSVSSPGSVFIYHLINKTAPPLLKLINLLYGKKELIYLEEINQKYMETCITLVNFMKRFDFIHLQPQRYQFMCNSLKELGKNYMLKANSKDSFFKACNYLVFLSKLYLHKPTLMEFQKLQDVLEREISEENSKYFKLLQLYLIDTTYKLSPINFKRLVDYIFASRHQEIQEHIGLRVVMLKIIKNHIINCGNQIMDDNFDAFSWIWEGDAYPLIEFAEELHECSDDDLKVLMEIMGLIIYEHTNPTYLVNQCLYPLMRYGRFRKILISAGFSLVSDEGDEEDTEDYDYD